ncbi:hypothetical protein [Bacillus thuringiensis]|nr:hypothetical protein [Bacillus thuringiensis]
MKKNFFDSYCIFTGITAEKQLLTERGKMELQLFNTFKDQVWGPPQ